MATTEGLTFEITETKLGNAAGCGTVLVLADGTLKAGLIGVGVTVTDVTGALGAGAFGV